MGKRKDELGKSGGFASDFYFRIPGATILKLPETEINQDAFGKGAWK